MSRAILSLMVTCALLSASNAVHGQDPAQKGVSKQPTFRVRSDFAAKLNSDQGWAGALNENVTIYADQPFRIRFEIERSPHSTGSLEFRLQYRRNDGDWTYVEAHAFPKPSSESPRVSIVSWNPNAIEKTGAATIDLLKGSAAAFEAGAGVNLAERTPPWKGVGAHGEFEWALVVRRFVDGAVTNEQDDTFEFRMVEAGGSLMASYLNPVLRLAIPRGHVGGTFVETPGRIGPWQAANGDLYFIMEPAETSNIFMMMKSTDKGATWSEVDGANRPRTKDLESVDARQEGDTIHIIHQVTATSRYHTFRTSDHPNQPDSWAIRDELIASAKSVAQAATLAVRSDRSVVAFYVGQTIHHNVRSPEGSWGTQAIIDAHFAPSLAGPQAVLGAKDTVHLAYYGTDGTIWYRKLLANGTLTAQQQLASKKEPGDRAR